jgi:hypothetical protein
VCDHTIFVIGAFMTEGENWRFATMLLLLLLQASICPLVFFYDINCRFGPHFLKWLQVHSGLSDPMKLASSLMHMPLPPFHAYMHNSGCRREFGLQNSRYPAWGRPNGEATEIFWSQMNRLARLKFSTLLFFSVFVEGLIADINERHDRRLSQFLLDRCRVLCGRIGAQDEELKIMQASVGDTTPDKVCSTSVISRKAHMLPTCMPSMMDDKFKNEPADHSPVIALRFACAGRCNGAWRPCLAA